jgi:2-haloacid dehalogenase
LTFDIIGTVFDVHGSLAKGAQQLAQQYGLSIDPSSFASAWVNGYAQRYTAVYKGQAPWTPPDQILRDALGPLLSVPQAQAQAAMNDFLGLWHQLDPWPDVAASLQKLHAAFTLAMLSNMSIATQVALRSYPGLPFDQTLSSETVKRYKPDPAVYQMAVSSLGLNPGEIMMVAAHKFDLDAAKGQGFMTAYVPRRFEFGPNQPIDTSPDPAYDVSATSFADLVDRLGVDPSELQDECLPIHSGAVQVREVGGRWKIVDGNRWLLDFGGNQAGAKRAKGVISHYGFDRICFVGRPGAPMMYFTVKGGSPAGAMAGEDVIAFHLAKVKAEQVGGSWIVTDGSSRMLDFGPSEVDAMHAAMVIKRYGFTHQCFVGRPGAPMMYFRR